MTIPTLYVNFNPFPVLETERMILKQLDDQQVDMLFELRSDPETMQYVKRPMVTTREEAEQHLQLITSKIEANEGINWGLYLREQPDQAIGVMGHYRIHVEHFRSEVGYMVLRPYWGRGLVTEALHAVLQYGFETMQLHSTEAIIDPANIASARVLEKNGFVKEAHFLENEFFEGKFIDTMVYSLLKSRWRAQPPR
ncbi:MAG TPA: GNAT family N-acetyltransferase [Flavobacterium sp.]|nr:GNAT family N-acetyltransferase [Flavobacterium sp.]